MKNARNLREHKDPESTSTTPKTLDNTLSCIKTVGEVIATVTDGPVPVVKSVAQLTVKIVEIVQVCPIDFDGIPFF